MGHYIEGIVYKGCMGDPLNRMLDNRPLDYGPT